MSREFDETIDLGGGLAGIVFDVAAGPANVGLIDVLLSVGNGSVTDDLPLWLRSTGALGAVRTLTLDGAEATGARMIFLDVNNTDIAANNLVVAGSTSINGAASITISEVSQWIMFHVGGGVWFALRQWPQNTVEGAAVRRLVFVAADWALGVVDEITITQSAGPGPGQIGPHGLDVAGTYLVRAFDSTGAPPNVEVNLEVEVDATTGDITLRKAAAPGVPDFPGDVMIIGDL